MFGFRGKEKFISLTQFEKKLFKSDPDKGQINHSLNSDCEEDCFQGFLVCEGGILSEKSRSPLMGFCVQKADVSEHMSPYTQGVLQTFGIGDSSKEKKVVGAHSYTKIHVLHTSMYHWLTSNFGWSRKPLILHALLWKSAHFERPYVDFLLRERRLVIKQLASCSEEEKIGLSIIKSTQKLILNASYGYCLLKTGGEDGKYKSSKFVNSKQLARMEQNLKASNKNFMTLKNIMVVPIEQNLYKVYKSPNKSPSPLACHGSTILAISKVIFFRAIYFLLKHLNPTSAQIIYCDTDSIHLAVEKSEISDNVPTHLKKSYNRKKDDFFDEDKSPSGMLITESVVDFEKVFAEKVYILKKKSLNSDKKYVFDKSIKSTASKGIPHSIEIDEDISSFFGIQHTMMKRVGRSKGVGICVMNKRLGGLLIPKRRFFFKDSFSIPFLFANKDSSYFRRPRPFFIKVYKKNNKIKKIESEADFENKSIRGEPTKTNVLTELWNKVPNSSELIDNAYRAKRKSFGDVEGDGNVYDVIYNPPKSLKRSKFISYEVSEAKD